MARLTSDTVRTRNPNVPPGTVSARLSADKRQLLVHALDCADPASLVATIKTRFEAPLKEILEC